MRQNVSYFAFSEQNKYILLHWHHLGEANYDDDHDDHDHDNYFNWGKFLF